LGKSSLLLIAGWVCTLVAWHTKQGFAGSEFGHHAVGRHSVASQAASCGESIKAIQAQLGHRSAVSTHRYTHVAAGAQLRLVESLKPLQPPHLRAIDTALVGGHGNLTATNEKKHSAPRR
jgi:hypothetical protein